MSDGATARRKKNSASSGGIAAAGGSGYLSQSSQPWSSLVFLIPFIIIYELGLRPSLTNPVHLNEIYAFKLMQEFFLLFGASGRYLPPLAVVGILLSWHIARKDSWKVRMPILAGMFFESLLLGIPLIFISYAFAQYVPLGSGGGANVPQHIYLSLGAGIYEELVFRLCGMTIMTMAIMDMAKIRKSWGNIIVVLVPAVLFSLYHYVGPASFSWQTFLFRTTAGVYFGVIFLCRGFGITAGSHAAYDVMVTLLPLLARG